MLGCGAVFFWESGRVNQCGTKGKVYGCKLNLNHRQKSAFCHEAAQLMIGCDLSFAILDNHVKLNLNHRQKSAFCHEATQLRIGCDLSVAILSNQPQT